MDATDRATAGVAVAVALLLVLVGAGVVLGMADDEPTGESVLNDTRERYVAAETVTVDATVRVENESAATEFDVEYVAADDGQARLTVEKANRSVVAGTNGSAYWTFVPATGVGATYHDGTVLTVDPTGNVTSYDLGANESVPFPKPGHDGAGEAPGYNGTHGPHGHNGTEVWDDYDGSGPWGDHDGSDHWDEHNVTAMVESLGEPGAWHGENATDRYDGSAWNHSDGHAPRENVTVERVETTDYDGERVHVVSVAPENESIEGELRYWIRAEDSVIVRQELRTPNATVTVAVHETRFDVSVADSTFRPPTAEDGTAGLRPVNSPAALNDATPYAAATLDADETGLTFEGGAVTSIGADDATTAVARYGDDGATVTLAQTDGDSLPGEPANATETTVGDRTVHVAETDDRVVVWWAEGDTTVGLTGDVSRDRLLELVEAVERPDGDG